MQPGVPAATGLATTICWRTAYAANNVVTLRAACFADKCATDWAADPRHARRPWAAAIIAATASRLCTPTLWKCALDSNDGHRNSYGGQKEEEKEVHRRVCELVLSV
jgi:hypothetical protein